MQRKSWIMKVSLIFVFLTFVLSTGRGSSPAAELEAYFSKNGIVGTIKFIPDGDEDVKVKVDLTTDKPGEYSWGIYGFPIEYLGSGDDPCHSKVIGRKPEINLDEEIEKLNLNETFQGEFRSSTLKTIGAGKDSIWGRGLVLEGPDKSRVCASIFPKTEIRTAEARYESRDVGGHVWFISVPGETRIYTNLFRVSPGKSSRHKWQIYISDSFDSHSKTCDFLQILYDPGSKDNSQCSTESPENCKEGDLTSKFGEVKVGQRESLFSKSFHTDSTIEIHPELQIARRALYLVIFDDEHPNSFLACTEIKNIPKKKATADFDVSGVKGFAEFEQVNRFLPVQTRISLDGLNQTAGGFHVHEFPVDLKRTDIDTPCSRSTGGHFNPHSFDASSSPEPGQGTFDRYEVGDFSGKYGSLAEQKSFELHTYDPTLSLFGKMSIVGRSMVIHEHPIPKRWICSNIRLRFDEKKAPPMIVVEALFTYPITGKIIFEQDASNPNSDTSIFVSGLVYSDGTKNDTIDHDWHVHVSAPGKDFYNWTGRCISAGGHFNPFRVPTGDSEYNDCVNNKDPFKCQSGDLANKHGSLKVSGKVRNIAETFKFLTDSNLALSGRNSILGRSIVIHDKNAPVHRGDRLACTTIKRRYRHKTVAREWFGNGVNPPPISGRLEFIQESQERITHSLIDLHGLDGIASSYHVHKIPVQNQLEFPCTGDAVGNHFNPFKVDPSQSPPNREGTDDFYEIGDLSGKYGLVTDLEEIREIHNDTNLPLFGPNSIVGRSIVVHKKIKAARWACATLGWGFDPDEAREVRAIASFHHPKGFAWGYVRFRQVRYNDGSFTPTVMEIRLKYPGKTNKEQSHNHDWSVYINPVGHDAAVKFENARCTAAGYRWNPTHVQLADPLDHGFYSEECNPKFPWRCFVGDLSGKNGKISIGGKAYVIHDETLQLDSGEWFTSAIGKSMIIHGADGSPQRMACANIEKDMDIIKYATILTKGRFNLAVFMEEVRAIMGVPEWFLHIDSRKTKNLHEGKCVKIQVHFSGPHAGKLERDFTRLLRTGKLSTPSISIPGFSPDPLRKTKLGYTECDGGSLKSKRTKIYLNGSSKSNEISAAFAFISVILSTVI